MRKEDIENQEHRYLNRSLWSNLQSLKSTVSFMQTGAHPDDETLAAGATLKKLSSRGCSLNITIPCTGINSRKQFNEYEKQFGKIQSPKKKIESQNIKLPDDVLPN